MMKKVILTLVVVVLMGVCAWAAPVTQTYSWENGGGALSSFSTVAVLSYANSSEKAHTGNKALKIVEEGNGTDTPQIYLGWIKNIKAGDVISASIWVYDTTLGTNPSGRIWGHYAANSDINVYQGAGTGNNTYSAGDGWSKLEYSWTMAADKESFVVETRIYSGANMTNVIYVDDITITAPDTATIVYPVPEPMTLSMLALGGLALGLKKR